MRTLYEILAQPQRLPRGNDFVLGYGGANDYRFNSVVVEADRARRVIVVLTTRTKTAPRGSRTGSQRSCSTSRQCCSSTNARAP